MASGAEGETPTTAATRPRRRVGAAEPAPAPPPTARRTGPASSRRSSPASPPSTASTSAQVPGTGRGGRVTKKDILGYIESGEAAAPPRSLPPRRRRRADRGRPRPQLLPRHRPPRPRRPRKARRSRPCRPCAAASPSTCAGRSTRPRTSRARSRSTCPRWPRIRQKLKKEFQEAYGVNPTYLAFVARAAVETLKDYPWINGELRGDSIVTRNYVNLGFAVELADGKGLIVPVVKNAETLNLLGMAKAIADIASRAREKKLLPEDVQGGTFTITNPGGYGTFHGTPVISQPQAAHPRHVRGRQAAVGGAGRDGRGRDRDPLDHEPDADVRPSPRRRRPRRAASCATCANGSRPGASPTTRPPRRARRLGHRYASRREARRVPAEPRSQRPYRRRGSSSARSPPASRRGRSRTRSSSWSTRP